MSDAREDLFVCLDAEPWKATQLLGAYRAVVLREAAADIRADLAEATEKLSGFTLRRTYTAQHAADLIDPDKEQS